MQPLSDTPEVSAEDEEPEDLEEAEIVICRPEPVRVTTNLTITILDPLDQAIMSPHPKEDDIPRDDAFVNKSQEGQEATEEGEQTAEQDKLAPGGRNYFFNINNGLICVEKFSELRKTLVVELVQYSSN